MSKSLITTFSAKILVAAFNNLGAIIDKEEINKFSSIAVGVKRTEALFDKVNDYRAKNDFPLVAFTEAGTLVNVEPVAPVVTVSDAAPVTVKPARIVKAASAKVKKSPGRVAAVGLADVILVLVSDNPKQGTAAERYSKYGHGITVAAYVEALGGDRKQALRDIAWDSKKKWISVVGARSAAAKSAQAPKDDAPEVDSEQKLLPAPAALLMIAGPVAQEGASA